MSLEDIVKSCELEFLKAWEEFGADRPNISISSRTARYFFFDGAAAGAESVMKGRDEIDKEVRADIQEVVDAL